MKALPFLALTVLLAALMAVLWAESRDDGPPGIRPSAGMPSAVPARTAQPAADQRPGFVTDILTRPLFAANRRPARAVSVAAGAPASLPRLTGVLVSNAVRTAFFSSDGGARAIMAEEGGKVGDFVVKSITAGEVTMQGPDGLHVLHPRFDPALDRKAAGTAASAPAPMSILDLLRNGPPPTPGVPGLPPQPGAQKP